MPFDEALAERIRDHLADRSEVVEKKMFGGLGFMERGHMGVAASSQGGLLVRVDPDDAERLVGDTPAEPMEMRGRSMTGWLHVEGSALGSDGALHDWVDRGMNYAATLPPKS